MIQLPVMHPREVSFPSLKGDEPGTIDYAPLSEILTQAFDYDAHLAAYSKPEIPHRLNLKAPDVPLVLALFDVDPPDHQATEAWRKAEAPKIAAFLKSHPVSFVYDTRGGYRIVGGFLPDPHVVRTPEDAETWKAFYLTWCRYLARRFSIVADVRCKDWTRLYRVPYATRDDVLQAPQTYGIPDVGAWDPQIDLADLVEPTAPKPLAEARDEVPTTPEVLAMARKHLQTIPPSVQGRGGDAALFKACKDVFVGFNLPRYDAEKLLTEVFDPLCDPPWGYELPARLDHNLDNLEATGSGWGDLVHGVKLREAVATKVKPPPDPSKWTHTLAFIDKLGGDGKRLPTGIETLDKATRGGLRHNTLMVLGGAPGAGKTTLAMQLAYHYAKAGEPVAILAADESADGLLTRVGQSVGISREALEDGLPFAKERLRKAILDAPFDIYDQDQEGVTVETVAKVLAEKGPGIMIVDSIQTARTDTSDDADGTRARVDDVVKTCKQAAAAFGHLMIVTSELARGSYRSKAQAEQIEDLAAFKESGGIEYAGRVLIVLRTAAGDGGVVDAAMPKNRLGRKLPFRLELDFIKATFKEVPIPEETTLPSEPEAMRMMRLKSIIWRAIRAQTDHFISVNSVQRHLRENGQKISNGDASDLIKELVAENKIQRQGQYLNAIQEPI